MDREFRVFNFCVMFHGVLSIPLMISSSSKKSFTRVHWQLMKHGRHMMSENAQQIDYICASGKLINKKGQILNLKHVLNSDHFQMFAHCSTTQLRLGRGSNTTQFLVSNSLMDERKMFALMCFTLVY